MPQNELKDSRHLSVISPEGESLENRERALPLFIFAEITGSSIDNTIWVAMNELMNT